MPKVGIKPLSWSSAVSTVQPFQISSGGNRAELSCQNASSIAMARCLPFSLAVSATRPHQASAAQMAPPEVPLKPVMR